MISTEEIIKTLQAKRIDLVNNYNITKLGLFGSYARGEQTNDSDVDILVEFGKPIGMAFIDLADELEKDLKLKVDLVSRKSIRQKIWGFIEQEVIYV